VQAGGKVKPRLSSSLDAGTKKSRAQKAIEGKETISSVRRPEEKAVPGRSQERYNKVGRRILWGSRKRRAEWESGYALRGERGSDSYTLSRRGGGQDS